MQVMLAIANFEIVGCLDPALYTGAESERPYGWKGMVPDSIDFDIIDVDLDTTIAEQWLKHFDPNRQEQKFIHVVVFEGQGSGGFNWYLSKEAATKAFEWLASYFDTISGQTKIAQFAAAPPSTISAAGITEYLYRNDVYGKADTAPKRRIVGRLPS